MVGSGLDGGGVAASPPKQPGDVDAMGWLILVGLDVVGAASEQTDRTGQVAAGGVRGAHGQLGHALPQGALRLGGALPGVFQHFMGVERHAVVQQPLGLDKGLVRRPEDALLLAGKAGRPAWQWSAQAVAWALVLGASRFVAVAINSVTAGA